MKTGFAVVLICLLGSATGILIASISKGSTPPSTFSGGVGTMTVARSVHRTGRITAPFLWSEVDSDDVRQYIAKLRGIECPEEIISDIVRARISAAYQERVNQIFNPLARYWSTLEETKSVDNEIKSIRHERDMLLDSLGLKAETAPTLNGLPEEKQQYVSEALNLYPKVPPDDGSNFQDWQPFLANRKARVDYLSQYLTPDELLDYRIANDGNAFGVRRLLRDMHPTDAEFRKVFSAIDGEDLSRPNGSLAEGLETKLQQILGDQRYTEYKNELTPENFSFNLFVHGINLTEDQIKQLRDVRASAESLDQMQYRQAVTDILKNPIFVDHYFLDPALNNVRRR